MLEWNCTEIYSCIQCLILHSADIAQDYNNNGIGHTSAENKYSAEKLILLRAKCMVKNKS